VLRIALLVVALALAVLLAPGATGQAPRNVVLVNQTFKCDNYPQPVDFDLVKVTVQAGTSRRFDGFHTGNCTGRIGRIEIETPYDGMKIQPGAHDLVIGGGYIHCLPVQGAVHQDGVQAMGGQRVTLRNVDIDCGTNSAMFINMGAGNQQLPTDIVCDGCTMKKLGRDLLVRVVVPRPGGDDLRRCPRAAEPEQHARPLRDEPAAAARDPAAHDLREPGDHVRSVLASHDRRLAVQLLPRRHARLVHEQWRDGARALRKARRDAHLRRRRGAGGR
jgi:hypothetical protein